MKINFQVPISTIHLALSSDNSVSWHSLASASLPTFTHAHAADLQPQLSSARAKPPVRTTTPTIPPKTKAEASPTQTSLLMPNLTQQAARAQLISPAGVNATVSQPRCGGCRTAGRPAIGWSEIRDAAVALF